MRTTMRGLSGGAFIHQLERLFQYGTTGGLTEGELLDRFVRANDESAFEDILARHGPMVMGVCRQLLRDPNDVDDAFQATFLVLVRKARSLRRSELLGNWLYGVAHRVATRARVTAARRSARAPFGTDAIDQHGLGDGSASGDMVTSLDSEPIPWLHEEVRRLPEKYRVPVLLCYFEGLTHEQAASRLGWPIGSVKGRLSRARDLLRKRLTRRGVALSAIAIAGDRTLSGAHIAVPEPLGLGTLRAARAVAGMPGASTVSSSAVSPTVATLVDGALRVMFLTHAKSISLALLVSAGVTTGLVLAAGQEPARPPEAGNPPPAANEIVKQQEPTDGKAALQKAAAGPRNRPGAVGGMMSPMRGAAGNSAGAAGGPVGDDGADDFFSNRESLVNGMTYEARLRLSIAELGSAVAVWDENLKNDRVVKALEQPLKMSFANPTPLSEVLKFIKSKMTSANGSLPIYVDPLALKESGLTLDSNVVIDLEGVPLKTSLRLVLKQLGLAYCVRDGVLIISSVEGVREELAEAAYELLGGEKKDAVDMRVLGRTGVIRFRMGGMRMGGPAGGMGGGGMGMM